MHQNNPTEYLHFCDCSGHYLDPFTGAVGIVISRYTEQQQTLNHRTFSTLDYIRLVVTIQYAAN